MSCLYQFATAQYSLSGLVTDDNGSIVALADVYEDVTGKLATTDDKGYFKFENFEAGNYSLIIYSFEYNTEKIQVNIADKNESIEVKLTPLSTDLSEVEIRARKKEIFSLKRLKSVEGTAIYEGKKTEVVRLDQIVGNLAINNPRQIYAQVAGLNIYENSDAGLQLNIGGRGLDPNRTSNFNTRQNSYDISADVLGYPESYYTPPADGLSEIQVVRGAASLQYGTQFGGLINFKMKSPDRYKKLGIGIKQSIGSFGLHTTFVEANGQTGKFGYYGFYNFKTGDGYRANSEYDSHNAFLYTDYKLSNKTIISLEATYLHYLAKQAGGLTDSQFEEDPRQSTRSRNWFAVDWVLYNAKLVHKPNKRSTLSLSFFGLDAQRSAVGYRGNPKSLNTNPITDIDEQNTDSVFISPRDLIKGTFNNWGVEARWLSSYKLRGKNATWLVGAKYYHASNTSFQGAGSGDTDADFADYSDTFTAYPNQSTFKFPNRNLALFGEHIFKINNKLSVTPGARFEYIKTASQGQYQIVRFDGAGNPIFNQTETDNRTLGRSLALVGVGLSFKPNTKLEVYGNFSQNYRSVTFSDIRTVNPTFIIDPDIADEKGWTTDIGARGQVGKVLSYDVGVFALLYNNRIGIILNDRANRVRKNIGTAFIYGLESYLEWNIVKSINADITDRTFSIFTNTSVTNSEYLSSESNNVEGKKVEFIPLLNLKTGIKIGYKNFLSSLQLTYLTEQFTDAENSETATPGSSREGIIGEVPAYSILDFSVTYVYKSLTFDLCNSKRASS